MGAGLVMSHLTRVLLLVACFGGLIVAAAMIRMQTAEYGRSAILASRFAGVSALLSVVAIAFAAFLAG
jgi:hypothetical protein